MKIAALIMAHAYPEQLRILLKRLSTPLWMPFVHLDLKSNTSCFNDCMNHAVFLPDRVKVFWGGFSQVQASLNLLRYSYDKSDCTHFYLLTGQCFPIISDSEIAKRASSIGKNGACINSTSLLDSSSSVGLKRLSSYSFNDLFQKRGLAKAARFFLRHSIPRRDVATQLRGLHPFFGSAYWVLDRSSVGLIFEFLENNSWYIDFFKHTHCPDESFFHSLLGPCGIDIYSGSPTAVFWQSGPNPLEINSEKLSRAKSEGFLFARKFNFADSPEIMSSLMKEF